MTVSGVRVQQSPADPDGQYFPAKQEVCGPNGGSVPVDIGSATVNLNGDVVAKFDGVEEALGTPADATAIGDSATSGLIGLVKRLLSKLPSSFQQGGGAVTSSTTRVTLATDGPGVAALSSIAGLTIPAHDYIALTYTGTNLTGVQYRTGGASGTIVGTLTLAYSGSNLTSVTKS